MTNREFRRIIEAIKGGSVPKARDISALVGVIADETGLFHSSDKESAMEALGHAASLGADISAAIPLLRKEMEGELDYAAAGPLTKFYLCRKDWKAVAGLLKKVPVGLRGSCSPSRALVKIRALWALGEEAIRGADISGALAAVENTLSDTETDIGRSVKEEGARMLALCYGLAQKWDGIQKLLKSKNRELRSASADGLLSGIRGVSPSRLIISPAIAIMGKILDDEFGEFEELDSRNLRRAAVSFLEWLVKKPVDFSPCAAVLEKALMDRDTYLRETAAAALASVQEKEPERLEEIQRAIAHFRTHAAKFVESEAGVSVHGLKVYRNKQLDAPPYFAFGVSQAVRLTGFATATGEIVSPYNPEGLPRFLSATRLLESRKLQLPVEVGKKLVWIYSLHPEGVLGSLAGCNDHSLCLVGPRDAGVAQEARRKVESPSIARRPDGTGTLRFCVEGSGMHSFEGSDEDYWKWQRQYFEVVIHLSKDYHPRIQVKKLSAALAFQSYDDEHCLPAAGRRVPPLC